MKDDDEVQKIWKEMGVSKEEFDEVTAAAPVESKPLHPALALGLGAVVLVNVGLLLSLPPVLRGRGAFAFSVFADVPIFKAFENSQFLP
jgi:hypothetical protein